MVTVRKIEPEDMPLLRSWAQRRGCELLDPLLSPYGFLAEDDGGPVLAVWAYMILDVPIIQLDHLLSVPGCSFPRARGAWQAISDAVCAWVRLFNERSGTGYCLIRGYTSLPAARAAEGTGWERTAEPFNCIHHVI